ncbi:inner membrane CreD family protein [Salmonella enterica subsp. enterica]|nr:inner membrane CreD family protein [Salmonella enterica subsp. enterica]
MTLTSKPHPNLWGILSSRKREISGSGISPVASCAGFATNLANSLLMRWIGTTLPAFSVAVSTPADQYQLTDRATKYVPFC